MKGMPKSWHSQGNFRCQGNDASLQREREHCKGGSIRALMLIFDAQDVSDANVCH